MKKGELYWLQNVGICRVAEVHLKDVSFEIIKLDDTKAAQDNFEYTLGKSMKFSMGVLVIEHDQKEGAIKKLNGIERATIRLTKQK